MDGFRQMLLVGRQHSADHIPVSALQRFQPCRARLFGERPTFDVRQQWSLCPTHIWGGKRFTPCALSCKDR